MTLTSILVQKKGKLHIDHCHPPIPLNPFCLELISVQWTVTATDSITPILSFLKEINSFVSSGSPGNPELVLGRLFVNTGNNSSNLPPDYCCWLTGLNRVDCSCTSIDLTCAYKKKKSRTFREAFLRVKKRILLLWVVRNKRD